MLLIGDSGSGKTGALASLAQAGFNLRILDLDNGLDILQNLVFGPNSPYPLAATPGRITFETLTEPMKNIAGRVVPAKATVWQDTIRMLDCWQEYDRGPDGKPVLDPSTKKPIISKDLGKLSTWTEKDILVIDSLTMLATAAFNFDAQLNGKLGIEWTQNEHRRAIGRAQDFIEKLLQLLYDRSICCNVIVTSHITYVQDQGTAGGSVPGEEGPMHGFPSALGRALSPRIPRYFNSVLYVRSTGSGSSARQRIYTRTQGIVNVKSSAPLKVKPEYPIETGLADYFRDLRS
jgi:AAA domain